MFVSNSDSAGPPAQAPRLTRRPSAWTILRGIPRRRWLYFPRLFSRRERVTIAALALVALASFLALSNRVLGLITVERPASGGTLREGEIGEPRDLNPLFASSNADRDITNLVFAKIIRYGPAGEIVMDLVKDVATSEDGRDYTVVLRDGITWHDGEPLTADDVVFTIRAIQNPEYQSPLRATWQGVGVERMNDRTIRFTLRQAYAPFIENLAVGIIPAHLWQNIPATSANLSDLNQKPIGAGPYRFQKLTRREDGTITSLVLERNEKFHGGKAYLNEIRFTFYPDEQSRIASYRRNEIDSFFAAGDIDLAPLRTQDTRIFEIGAPKVFGVFMNPGRQPALARRAVREALARAIDRDRIIREATPGSRRAEAAIPAGTFGFDETVAAPAFDPEASKAILAKDGWKDSDNDGVLDRSEVGANKKKTTQRMELEIFTSDAPELASQARLVAEMWQAIGVKTDVKTLAVSELQQAVIRPRAYQTLIFGEVFRHDPDPFAFWHTSQLKDPGLNVALYSNRKADQLLEDARKTSDRSSREAKYREFQRIVNADIAAIFLTNPRYAYIVRASTQGMAFSSLALPEDRFNSVEQWYQDTKRSFR